MKNLNIPVGISDFERIRELNYYYVDKTGLIKTLLQGEMDQVTLITRPRRFGKTMAMNMLNSFLDIRKDSRHLFKGLEISDEVEICEKWMNQYPTLFLSFKDVDGTTFENAFNFLKFIISEVCKQHVYLLDSDEIDEGDKLVFQKLKTCSASMMEIQSCILRITNMLKSYYKKPVILLIDEYDVPIAKASSNGYYKEMLEIMKGLLSTALKDNSSLKFAVITGCLKIAKESIFTGTNNFVSDTISSTRYNEYYGFTQQDVDKLLADAEIEEKADLIKEWYDGYNFGKIDVYCPWDVMNYVRDLRIDPDMKPASYWKNTSDNAIIRSFIDYAGSGIQKKMEKLMAGDTIDQKIEENLTYDYLHSSEENFWSILYLTGYLTRDKEEKESADGKITLKIPNKEIREIFETTVQDWFSDTAKLQDRKHLFDAVWNGDEQTLTQEISRLLRITISYHDYREDFYHTFLAGIFAGAGYSVESNKEHGEGRSDLVIFNECEGKVAVFEAKYSKEVKKLEEDCEKAIQQIDHRMYAKEFEDSYDEVICYGISFYKKRCVVKRDVK